MDMVARVNVEVDGAGRSGDVEGDVVFLGEDGEGVGANLVGGIAVSGNAVCAGDDAIDIAGLHHHAGGGVDNEGRWDAQLLELPGGETGSLKKGPGLGVEDAVAFAVFPAGANDADGGAESRSGEGAGVAVGEDCAVLGQQVFTKGSHAAVDFFILGPECVGPRKGAWPVSRWRQFPREPCGAFG